VVAARMVRAIRRPCRELWPKPMSRLSLNIATALPGLTDFFMGRIRDAVVRDHESCKARPDAESTGEALGHVLGD